MILVMYDNTLKILLYTDIKLCASNCYKIARLVKITYGIYTLNNTTIGPT